MSALKVQEGFFIDRNSRVGRHFQGNDNFLIILVMISLSILKKKITV